MANLLPIGLRHRNWGMSHNSSGDCRQCNAGILEDKTHLLQCRQPSNFAEVFKYEFAATWPDEENAAPYVADFLTQRGLNVTQFTGIMDNHLLSLLSTLPANVGKKPTALAPLKSLWRVVYYHIWIPRCETVSHTDRILGYKPLDKKRVVRPLTASTPTNRSLGFGRSQSQDRLIWHSTVS